VEVVEDAKDRVSLRCRAKGTGHGVEELEARFRGVGREGAKPRRVAPEEREIPAALRRDEALEKRAPRPVRRRTARLPRPPPRADESRVRRTERHLGSQPGLADAGLADERKAPPVAARHLGKGSDGGIELCGPAVERAHASVLARRRRRS
jgi:hypothetical protein